MMRHKIGRLGGFVLILTGVVGLSGCQAIYDDTKGWANRLEASILEAADDLSKGNAAPSSPDSSLEWVPETPERSGDVASGVIGQTAATMAGSKVPEAAGPGASTSAAPSSSARSEKAGAASTDNPAETPVAVIDPTGPVGAEPQVAAPPIPQRKPKGATAKQTVKDAPTAEGDPKKRPNTGNLVAHLSSLRSEEAARKEWQALKKAFPEQLSRFDRAIAKTEIAKRGTFYRVLAGPLRSRQAARELCTALKAKKQYCQVMKAPQPAEAQPSSGDGRNSAVRPVT
ncbi:SPOR domain-containing protein [Pelagibius sp.]|uniref:SPOR domain-containing protein n=1 Tax=Pelagibius sp. TaxID=1931238 RepID=UPI003B5063C8